MLHLAGGLYKKNPYITAYSKFKYLINILITRAMTVRPCKISSNISSKDMLYKLQNNALYRERKKDCFEAFQIMLYKL